MKRLLLSAAALALPVSAVAQTVTITSPNTVNPQGQPKTVTDVFVRNADGTIATLTGGGGGGGGGTVPTGTAGTPNTSVVTVQGITNGTPQSVQELDVRNTGTLALGTVGSVYNVPLSNGRGSVGFTVSGLTGSGATVQVEASNNSLTYNSANTTESSATSSLSSVLTTDGQFRVAASGRTNIQLRVTVAGSGTANIASNATTSTGLVAFASMLPNSTTSTGVIGGVDLKLNGVMIDAGPGASTAQTVRTITASNDPAIAKMPQPGTAGTSSPDVISVQGVTGGTPQPVAITGTLPSYTTTPSFNIATTGVGGSSGNPIYTTATGGATGAIGSAAPANASQMGGRDGADNLKAVRTDTRGGLAPAQGVVTTTRTALTASTATLVSAAGAASIGLTVQVEASPSAGVFLCTTQTTACSATNYDALIPSGAGAGTTYTFLFAPSTALYAFSTAAPVLVANRWSAQ